MHNLSKLNSHLGYQLRLLSNAVSQSFANKLRLEGITVAEWVILREMYNNDHGTLASFIAQVTGLTRGAVSKLIERLYNKGLVTRIEVAHDRRYQKIKLTSSAINLVPKLSQIADQNDTAFFDILNNTEQDKLRAILTKLLTTHKLTNHPIN